MNSKEKDSILQGLRDAGLMSSEVIAAREGFRVACPACGTVTALFGLESNAAWERDRHNETNEHYSMYLDTFTL